MFLRGLSTSMETNPDALVTIPKTATFSSGSFPAVDVFEVLELAQRLMVTIPKINKYFATTLFPLSMFCRFAGVQANSV